MSALSIVALVVAYLVGIAPAGALFEWLDSDNAWTPYCAVAWPGTMPLVVSVLTLAKLSKVGVEWVRAHRRRGTP